MLCLGTCFQRTFSDMIWTQPRFGSCNSQSPPTVILRSPWTLDQFYILKPVCVCEYTLENEELCVCVSRWEDRSIDGKESFCTCASACVCGVVFCAWTSLHTCVWPRECSCTISEPRSGNSSVIIVILLEPRLSGSFYSQATQPNLP